MKKIIIMTSLFIGTVLLASCSDDNGSNPVLNIPEGEVGFTLNTPALSSVTYDLANSDGITLTWSQPDYGYTAATRYYAQVSLNNDFSEAEPGHLPNYAEVDGAATSCSYTFPANLVDAALLKAGLIDEPEKLPYLTDLYIRLRATVGANDNIISNVIKLKVKPYYQELSEDPVLWYIAGDCIGDGQETNDSLHIGVSLIPLSAVSGAKYNFNGDGEFTLIDYFPAGGKFRLLTNPGVKDVEPKYFGFSDGTAASGAVGNEGYFVVGDAGFYKLTFNSKNSNFTFEATDAPTVYKSISVPGTINSWDQTGNHMTPCNMHDGINHVWYFDWEFANKDEVKFAADDSWTKNWGSEDFPMGFGVDNGSNVKVTQKGKYRVLFNDVTGFYSFMKLPKE